MRHQWIKPLVVFCCILTSFVAVSCSRPSGKPRVETFLAVEEPVKISNLTLPGLVTNSQRELFLTLFIHSAFPSATEAVDAIAVLKSEDAGETWTEIARIPSRMTYGVWGYDLAVDERDGLHMTWVATLYQADSPQPFKAILYSRSDDGGHNWIEPKQVSAATIGQRRNPVVAAFGNDISIAWLDDQKPGGGKHVGGTVYCGSSTDRGATWSESTCLETNLNSKDSSSGIPSLCIGPNGDVYCAYHSSRSGNKGGLWIGKSTDRGQSFALNRQTKGILGDVSTLQIDSHTCLAAVSVTGVENISNLQTKQELRFHTSNDRGSTWNNHVLIDDDPTNAPKNNVKLIFAGEQRILACWNDKRGGVYMAVSSDGGVTWGKDVRVAGASRIGITHFDITADATTGSFHIAFSDVRQGSRDATFLVKGRVVPK